MKGQWILDFEEKISERTNALEQHHKQSAEMVLAYHKRRGIRSLLISVPGLQGCFWQLVTTRSDTYCIVKVPMASTRLVISNNNTSGFVNYGIPSLIQKPFGLHNVVTLHIP